MSQETLEPDEVEEETHIIHERIIEEANDQQQQENEDLLEEYVIKGAAFTLGASLLLLIGIGLFALMFEGEIITTVIGTVLTLLIIAGLLEYTEE